MITIHQLSDLVSGTVVKRPSASIKSPYVADVTYEDNTILGHCPSLGCCGLADKDATVLMAPAKNPKSKCQYTVYLSSLYDEKKDKRVIVGIHPKLAEQIVENCISRNHFSWLPNISNYTREFVIKDKELDVDSRFDFHGFDNNNQEFIVEVKTVPLADYEDIPKKERKGKNYDEIPFENKIAYFPDGYRKKATDPVSPRALKHVNELRILKETKNIRTILCFVIQRNDVSSFQPSIIDPIYRDAVYAAKNAGVEIYAVVCKWHQDGSCQLVNDNLHINW